MPVRTYRYKLPFFGMVGDGYSVVADTIRTQIIENQLVSYLDIFGGGVINGLNIFDSTDVDNPFDVILEEGLAVVPFDYRQVITYSNKQIEQIETHHIAIKVDKRHTIELSPNTITGLFLYAPDSDRIHGTFTILALSNFIRNCITTTTDKYAYKLYTIEGNIPVGFSVKIFINSKQMYGGYTLIGNEINFSSRLNPNDIVTAQIVPNNSLMLSIVITNSSGIANIDNSVRIDLRKRAGDELIGDQIKAHKHNATVNQPSKIILTTSTNYCRATASDDAHTIYEVSKATLIENTDMVSEWLSTKGTSSYITGNTFIDVDTTFLMEGKVDRKKGYFLNPNTDQSTFIKVISNTNNSLIVNANVEDYCEIGDSYLLVPYEIQLAINGKEEYYGYYLLDDDNTTIKIKMIGSLESTDTVDVKLFYAKEQSEISGILNVESDSSHLTAMRTINFGGNNFKSGTVDDARMPNLDHAGRTKEIAYPYVSSYGANGNGWKTDTFDLYTYRPRTDSVNSIRNIQYIIKNNDASYYLCANNTIIKNTSERLFGEIDFSISSYMDFYKPTKIIEQQSTKTLYAFNSKLIVYKEVLSNTWDEFLNLTSDANPALHPYLTAITSVTTINDLASDSLGRLYLATSDSLYLFNPVYSKQKMWYEITTPNYDINLIAIWEYESDFALFLADDASPDIWVSHCKPKRLKKDSNTNATTINIENVTGLSVGDDIIITDINTIPSIRKITAITDTILTINIPLTDKFVAGRSLVLKQFQKITLGSVGNVSGLHITSDYDLVINNTSSLQVISASAISASTYTITSISSAFTKIVSYAYQFDSHFIAVENQGVYRYTGSAWLNLSNSTYDTSINTELVNTLFLYADGDDLYAGTSSGLFHCSTDSILTQQIYFRNSLIYFCKPLLIENNVFKTRIISGSVGITLDDATILITYGERRVYITADLSQTAVNDYLYFTVDGGGVHVGYYYRILGITAYSAPKNQYYVDLDSYDGTFFDISDVVYGETFYVIPALQPIPFINGIPQTLTYTSNINSYSVDYGTQSITFAEVNNYTDTVIIATSFTNYVPKRGEWDSTKTAYAYLNGRNITSVSGSWSSIAKFQEYNSQTQVYDIKTKLTASNTVFRALNLAGRSMTVNVTKNLSYTIQYNTESYVVLNGDYYDAITTAGAVSAGSIPYNINLISFKSSTEGSGKYNFIEFPSPIKPSDIVRITIKNVYISSGTYSHEEIEDNFSEEHTGLETKLDETRNSNFLQLFMGLKEFASSIHDDFGTNIEYIKFTDSSTVDLINSTIENSKLTEHASTDYKTSYYVFGLLYSSAYGGLYALTENGVFFRPDTSAINTRPRWEKLADFLDTINAEGLPTIDANNPGGFYIGYDKDTEIWRVSWGGFHTSEVKDHGLSDYKIVAVQLDRLNSNKLYIATEQNGIIKSEDNGTTCRVIYNANAYNFTKTKNKDLRLHSGRNYILYLVTENGLYKSIDGGENFELAIKHVAETGRYTEYPHVIEIFTGLTGVENDVYYGASSLFYRNSFTDVNINQTLTYNVLTSENITFENVFNLEINDICIDQTDSDRIYLATNNGVYRTLSGIGSDLEYSVISAQDVFVVNAPYSYITVSGILTNINLPMGTFILPNKLNKARSFEVTEVVPNYTTNTTRIKVKGTVVNSAKNPLVKAGDIFAVKRWNKLVVGINDPVINSIAIDPVDNDIIYCGTNNDGVYKLVDSIYWEKINTGLPTTNESNVINISKLRVIENNLYLALRENGIINGGFYKYVDSTWTALSTEDTISFDVNGSRMIIGTIEGAYYSANSGTTWTKIALPSEDVLALDWLPNAYSSIIGTNGAGIFFGNSLGDLWKQNFYKTSILQEIRAMYWRVMDLQQDNSESDPQLLASIQEIPNDIDEYASQQLTEYKASTNEDTNDVSWTENRYISAVPSQNMWADQSNYPFMTKQTLASNLLNKDKVIGFLHNGFIRDPYAQERFFIYINDHQIVNDNFKTINDDVLSRQGGAIITDSFVGDRLQNSKWIPSRSCLTRSPRTFVVNDLILDSSNRILAATENAGVFRFTNNPFVIHYNGRTGTLAGTSLTTNDLNDLANDLDDYQIDLVNSSDVFADTLSGSGPYTLSDSYTGVYNYAISPLRIVTIDGETTFATIRALTTLSSDNYSIVGDYSSAILDKVIISCEATVLATLPTPVEGDKFFFAPHIPYVLENGIYPVESGNYPFIIHSASVSSNLIVYLKTSDVEFDSGNTQINVDYVYNADGQTILILEEDVPFSLSKLTYCRFQPNVSFNYFCSIANIVSNKIYITDTALTIYNTITTTGTIVNDFKCRFIYSIAFLDGDEVTYIPYIQLTPTSERLTTGLSSYLNEYLDGTDGTSYEYKVSFIKLLAGATNIYAATQPAGLMKYNGATWSSISSLDELYLLDLDWSSESGYMYICTRNKIYYSSDKATWHDITPDIPIKKFNSIKCVASSDDECYITTQNHGIYYTNDHGTTWITRNNGLNINTCPQWKFAHDADDISVVYAYGFASGIFKRNNGYDATTYNDFVDCNAGLKNKNIIDLWAYGDVLYAATATGGILNSLDGAVSWSEIDTSSIGSKLIRNVASFIDDTDIILAIIAKDDLVASAYNDRQSGENLQVSNNSSSGLYRSEDGGITWSLIVAIDVSGSTELSTFEDGIVYYGQKNSIYKSEDYGETFTLSYSGIFNDVYFIDKTYGKTLEIFASINNNILISLDDGETWTERKSNIETLLGVSAFASSDPILIEIKSLITYTTPSPIRGYVSSIIDEKFNIEDHGRTYYNYAGATARFQNGSTVIITKSTDAITEDSGFLAPGIGDAAIKVGDYCEISGFSQIVIKNPDAVHVLNASNYGLWVNLYLQIDSDTPLPIAEYKYNSSDDTIIIYVIGVVESVLDGTVYTTKVKIGPLDADGEIDNITNIFFSANTGYYEFSNAITLNYFDFYSYYFGDYSIRQSSSSSSATYNASVTKGGWYKSSTNSYYLISDNKFLTVSSVTTNPPSITSATLHVSLGTSGILEDGIYRNSVSGYITKSDSIYTNTTPEANSEWTENTNKSYYNLSGTTTYTTINFPIIISSANTDVAYLIVDKTHLINTQKLSSWASGGAVVWYEKTLKVTGKENFDYTWIKNLRPHPESAKTIFACVNDGTSNSTNNGLYISRDFGANWKKIYVDPNNLNLPVIDVAFQDSTGDVLLVAVQNGTTFEVYSNALGTYGDNVTAVEKVDDAVLVGSDYGLSLIDIIAKEGDIWQNTFNREDQKVYFINQGSTYLYVGLSGRLLLINKSTLTSTTSISSSITKQVIFPDHVIVNNTYVYGSYLYIATSKGLYYILESQIGESTTHSSLVEIIDARGKDVNDILIDGNNEMWIATSSGLLHGYDNVFVTFDASNSILPDNINCLAVTPQAIALVEDQSVDLNIPSTSTNDSILIVKSYNAEAVDSIIDGTTYSSVISGIVDSMSYDSTTNETTITITTALFGEDDSIAELTAIFDTNFLNPVTISSSTTTTLNFYGTLSTTPTKVNVYQLVDNSDYVLYAGEATTSGDIFDYDVLNGENYKYYIYYFDSLKNYYSAFKFDITPSADRDISLQSTSLFVGTDIGAFKYDYNVDEFTTVWLDDDITQIKIDERNNAIIMSSDHVIRHNDIDQKSIYIANSVTFNDLSNNEDELTLATSNGIQIVEDASLLYTIDRDYLVFDYLENNILFFKTSSTTLDNDDVLKKITFHSYNSSLYAISKKVVFYPSQYWFALKRYILENESTKELIDILYSPINASTLVYNTVDSYLASDTTKSFNKLMLASTVKMISYPFIYQLFDGFNLFLACEDSGRISDGEIQFLIFKMNQTQYYLDYTNSVTNAFTSGTGLACNSYNNVIYDGVYSIEFDDSGNLWAGCIGGIFLLKPSTTTWIKMPFSTIGENNSLDLMGYNDYLIHNTQRFIPVSMSSLVSPSGVNGILLNINVNRSFGFINIADLSRKDDIYNSVIGNNIYSFFVSFDGTDFSATKLSNGFFEEREPYFVSKNIDQNTFYYSQTILSYKSVVTSRSRGVNLYTDRFAPLIGNDHCDIEHLLVPYEYYPTNTKYLDGAVKYAYNSALNNNYLMPHNFGRKTYEIQKDVLERYRSYHTVCGIIDNLDYEIIYIVSFNPPETDAYSLYSLVHDYTQIFKSVDGGVHWCEINISGELDGIGKISKIIVDPSNSNVVYVAFTSQTESDNGVYYSCDGGLTFIDISGNLPDYPVSSLHLIDNLVSGGILYAGLLGRGIYYRNAYVYGYGYDTIYGYGYGYEIEGENSTPDYFDVFGITTPVEDSWLEYGVRMNQRNGLGLAKGIVNDIDICNSNNDLFYAATEDNGVIKSIDGGETWQFDIEGLPSLACKAIKISTFNESIVWLGTELGFYYKDLYTNEWVRNTDIPLEEVKFIATNENLTKNVISFNYTLPDSKFMDGVLILRKEGSRILYVPQTGNIHVSNSNIGDAFVVYSGEPPDSTNYVVEFYDELGLKAGVEYYYDFYTYEYQLVDSSVTRIYTKFPNVYSYELHSFTSNTITVNTSISGSVQSLSYDSAYDVTTIVDDSNLDLTDSETFFGIELVGQTITFTKTDLSTISFEITDAYKDSIQIGGDYVTELTDATYVIDTSLAEDYKDYIINPNTNQLQNPISNGIELLFSVKSNTTTTLTIKDEIIGTNLDGVAGMHTPAFGAFGDKSSTIFAITSSKRILAETICPLYVSTVNGLYYSLDNGLNFTKIDLSSISDDIINYVSFANEDNIIDIAESKIWLAGNNGLYYTQDHFGSFVAAKTHEDGKKYLFVIADDADSNIVYAFVDTEGMYRSINGGENFTLIDTDINSQTIREIIYLSTNTNYFLAGTQNEAVTLLKDSVRDKFNAFLDTDYSFEELNYYKFKIGDSLTGDANSIIIESELKPNALADEINSIEFQVNSGKYIKSQFNYNDTKADTSIIYVGKDNFNPSSNPFRLRRPGSVEDITLGFCITQLSDNTLLATTNSGVYYSIDGTTWTKVDNFLIPDIVYDAIKLKDDNIYLGTNNGVWVNTSDEMIEFKPKNQLGRKIKSLWDYKRGTKSISFVGSDEGVRIKYKNFGNIFYTTPQNFDSDDGIEFSWGIEDITGNTTPGGLDQSLLDYLNLERYFEDARSKTGLVRAYGWSGTLIIRFEGLEESGFVPQNQVIYEKDDRRYIDAVRQKQFDIVAEDANIGESELTTFGFPDGLVIVDNIRTYQDRETTGVLTPPENQDTFTSDYPYNDVTSVSAEEDVTNEFGANPNGLKDSNYQLITNGAELKASTTYVYTLFAYYLRPPNFVMEGDGSGGYKWIPIYSRVNVQEFNIRIPISHMPNATIVTCGTAFDEYHYLIGTDDGVFYANYNVGLKKSTNTDNNIINCILLTSTITTANNYAYQYGYGYGYYGNDGIDYFDVFGIDGFYLGYTEYGVDTYHTYGFCHGYEMIKNDTVFIGTNIGIFISYDGGESFTQVFDNATNGVRSVFSLAEDGDNIIYAGTDRGIFVKNIISHDVWTFESFPGTSQTAPYGKFIGQSFEI